MPKQYLKMHTYHRDQKKGQKSFFWVKGKDYGLICREIIKKNKKGKEYVFSNYIEPDYWEKHPLGNKDKQLQFEFVETGGHIYRLLLGKSHPKYYTACSKANEDYPKPMFLRLSERIVDLKEDFTKENEIKSLHGFYLQIVFSLFLGDPDTKNIGYIDKHKYQQVIRFDPELCFSEEFFQITKKQIRETLECLANCSIDDEHSCGEYNRYCCDLLIYHDTFGEYIPKYYPTIEKKRNETYAALCRMFQIPFARFKELITKHVSIEYSIEKKLLAEVLCDRIKIFKEIAFTLPDFEEFYLDYHNSKSEISRFYSELFGDIRIEPEKLQVPNTPAYRLQTPKSSESDNNEDNGKMEYDESDYYTSMTIETVRFGG